MINTKTIIIGSLFAAIAAMFQLTPVFLSEALVFMTIFSAIPIYIVSRINPKAGVLSYFVTAMIVMILSAHEGIFFLFTNGIIGISLGICSYYTRKKAVVLGITSFTLTVALGILNFGIGIPIIGIPIPGVMIIQFGIIFLISAIYSIFYYYFSSFIFNLLEKNQSIIKALH